MDGRIAAVHALAVMPDDCWPGRVLFDIDQAVELADGLYSVTAATLAFEQASDVVGGLSLVGEAFEPTIDDIVQVAAVDDGRFQWSVSGVGVNLRLTAGLWTVESRHEPVTLDRPRLRPGERGGIGFPGLLGS